MVQFDKSCTLTFGTSWQDCGSDALKCTKVSSASQDEVLGRCWRRDEAVRLLWLAHTNMLFDILPEQVVRGFIIEYP